MIFFSIYDFSFLFFLVLWNAREGELFCFADEGYGERVKLQNVHFYQDWIGIRIR